MFYSTVRYILLFVLVCAFPAFSQVTSSGVEPSPNYDAFSPPTVGSTYTDPVLGAKVQRVSNALATPNVDAGGNLTWIANEYSTPSAFNSDNSYFILVHESYFGLYNGSTGAYMYALPLEINSSSEPRWSRKDNATLYYHSGNQLKSYNVSSGATAVVHTFSEYTSISGNGEMDISLDGDHFVFCGDNQYIFVYQISADKKFSVLDTTGHGFDSMYITPQNNVIVSWLTNGTARFTGQELFDGNMNFLRQISHADGHKDVTVDTNGDEVLIWTNSNDPQPIANCNNGIVKIRLADATQTCLLQLDWSLAVHISAPDGNGTVFVDTEAPSNPLPGASGWVAYTNEILQVKLDGSGTTRWAQHRSVPVNSYNWEPKASISRDGTRLLYASNFDLSNIDGDNTEYGDTYMIVLPSTGVASTSGSTASTSGSTQSSSTGGSSSSSSSSTASTSSSSSGSTTSASATTAIYQETSSSVQYTGAWYPNSGAFNLGGSATLSMEANSAANFAFTGTGVQWIGFSDPWSGIAQVYLDGALTATIDTYDATQTAQKVQYTVSNLANTSHTLKIVVTGTMNPSSQGAWVWVDAFAVTTPAASTSTSSETSSSSPTTTTPAPITSGPVSYSYNDPTAAYNGTWYNNSTAPSVTGSSTLAMDKGSTVAFTFSGSAVSWIGYRDQWSGKAQVYLDGKLLATVDTYSASTLTKATVYSAKNLTETNHTLTIKVLGTHDSASAGAWVWVDAFDVTP